MIWFLPALMTLVYGAATASWGLVFLALAVLIVHLRVLAVEDRLRELCADVATVNHRCQSVAKKLDSLAVKVENSKCWY